MFQQIKFIDKNGPKLPKLDFTSQISVLPSNFPHMILTHSLICSKIVRRQSKTVRTFEHFHRVTNRNEHSNKLTDFHKRDYLRILEVDWEYNKICLNDEKLSQMIAVIHSKEVKGLFNSSINLEYFLSFYTADPSFKLLKQYELMDFNPYFDKKHIDRGYLGDLDHTQRKMQGFLYCIADCKLVQIERTINKKEGKGFKFQQGFKVNVWNFGNLDENTKEIENSENRNFGFKADPKLNVEHKKIEFSKYEEVR